MSATEAGAFRARNDPPSSYYRVSLEVAYVEGAEPAAMRRAINECHVEAITELERRFNKTTVGDRRRQREERP